MDEIKLLDILWRNYHKLDFNLMDSFNYFQREDLMIDDSLRFRIIETLTALIELKNELYRNIRSSINVKPFQRKLF